MNREQIIQMARHAGIFVPNELETVATDKTGLERFAAAVRAATKEEDAKICDDAAADWYSVIALDCAEAIRASK